MQPGETINPGQTGPDSQTTPPPVSAPAPEPTATPAPAVPTPTMPAPAEVATPSQPPQETETPSLYKPALEDQEVAEESNPGNQTISWEGSEYIDHQKPAGWYVLFGVAAIVITVLAYILTHGDYVVTGSIGLAIVLFGIMAARKPRTLQYVIDHQGVTVGGKRYNFNEFKVFSVITDTAIHSVQLLPMKRFLPPLSLHYPPDQEEQIVSILGSYLPYQEGGRDRVEQLMSRIRF